jgi:hypothetical protein
MDGIDIPEPGEYEEGLEREGFRKTKPEGRQMFLGIVSLVLLAVFIMWLAGGFR